MFGISTALAGGFAGLISLFNMGRDFFWSSTSDLTGRKTIYAVSFAVGAVLYALIPFVQRIQSIPLFVAQTAVIICMYGRGFAMIPAYFRDLLGTMHLGAIHGRLITAWSRAAVLGPQAINYISTYQMKRGVPKDQAYNSTMYLMSILLIAGFLCNLFVKPVH